MTNVTTSSAGRRATRASLLTTAVLLAATAASAATTTLVVNPLTPVFSGNNVVDAPGDHAPGYRLGSIASNGLAKTDMYFTPSALFGRAVTLGEIVSMEWWTKKGTTHAVDANDWYMLIYTNPYVGDVSTPTWYGDRIGSEPYFSANINDPASTWNLFRTPAGNNRLRFFESTQGAPGANLGSYSDPHWDTFVAGNALSGQPYATRSVLYFSIQTASGATGFTGKIDGFRIVLSDASEAIVNFEPACDVNADCNDSEDCTTDTCTPADGLCHYANVAATTPCGSTGDNLCDNPDTCDGAGSCLPNNESSSTMCRAVAGSCDVAENCDGAGACPADSFLPNGTLCRTDAGQCDVAENCTGSAAACPANAFEPNTTACTGSSQTGVCDNDASDRCSGTANTCVDAFKSAATLCRTDAGQCDVAENCTGSAGACPANAFEPNTTACTGSSQTGVCDNDASDRCSGSANTCVDAFKTAATVCRADSGECDVAENCTGSAGACPADAFEPNGTACGSPDDTDCTNPDTCNGANSCLPNHEPFGTVCDDERICTINDACDGAGECDANATLFKDTCTYFAVGARESGRILGHIGNNGAVTGDLCFDTSKVFAFTALTGNLVATADSGSKGHRFGEGATITGDVVTDGAGVFSIKGAFLPHLTPAKTSLAGGTVTAKDAVPGGTYDLSGASTLVGGCTTARGDLLDAADTIDSLAATQSYGDTTIASGDTLAFTAAVPGGLNVIDYDRIRGGSDVTINVDGGGNADSIVIVRVGSRFQLRENSVIQMTNSMQAKNFVLYVARGRTDIGNTSTVAGTIYGRGFVRLGEDVIVDGQVFGSGGKLEINSGVLATLEPNEIVLP